MMILVVLLSPLYLLRWLLGVVLPDPDDTCNRLYAVGCVVRATFSRPGPGDEH